MCFRGKPTLNSWILNLVSWVWGQLVDNWWTATEKNLRGPMHPASFIYCSYFATMPCNNALSSQWCLASEIPPPSNKWLNLRTENKWMLIKSRALLCFQCPLVSMEWLTSHFVMKPSIKTQSTIIIPLASSDVLLLSPVFLFIWLPSYPLVWLNMMLNIVHIKAFLLR